MIYRPHFTYIEAATPEQKQAREAAANEEWRKRLILHSITPEWHPPRPEHKPKPVHILPLPIVRPHPEHEEWRIFHPEWHPEYRSNPPRREPIINPPGIHILPLPIIRPRESSQENNEKRPIGIPHGTPVSISVGTPVHESNSSEHIVPSPTVRQEQHERPIGITITQPPPRKPLMLSPNPPRREPIINPPGIHILPLPIIRPRESSQETQHGTPVHLPNDIHIVPSPIIRQEQNKRGTPVSIPVGTPVHLPNDIHIVPSPIVRPRESEQEQQENRPIGITITQPPRGKSLMLPPIHETSHGIPIRLPHNIRIVLSSIYESTSSATRGTPVTTPVGTPVRLPNNIHIVPSPIIRSSTHESEVNPPIHALPLPIVRPHGEPLMLPPTHEPIHENTPSHGTPVSIPVGTPVRLPNNIHIVPSPVSSQEQNESNRPIGITVTQPPPRKPLMLPPLPTHETNNTSPPSTNSQQIIDNMISQGVVVGRILSGIEHTEGVSTSPPLQQTSPQPTVHQTVPVTIGRILSAIEHTEGVSTSPPLQQTLPQPQQTSPPPANPQQMIDNMISQGVNLPTQSVETNNPSGSIIANAATSQKSQSSNPLGAFFGSLGSDIANAAKDVGNAVTGALSTANNAIQNTYNSIYGSQTQQEKQQLQNQLNKLQQQAQQELSQIGQEKQQVQSQLQQVQQQAQQELTQINQQKQQVQNQLGQVQTQAQQELSQVNQQKQQVQNQLNQVQTQAQQELSQINQEKQQLQNELQQVQQYETQANQMLQQNPGNQQLQSYLQQLQQEQQQIQQGLTQLNQAQQQIQTQEQQVQQQAQQELTQLNQAQQQVQSQLQQAQQQAQQELTQLNQAQQQVQTQLNQVQTQAQQELTQLNQAQQQIQTQEQQAQQQIQQQLTQLNKQGGNPFQQFFNDIADVSALVGYYGTEALGGTGEELSHIAQGKGLENFGQAVSQFNRAGGQNIAKTVGDVTEVALPAIATAVVAPELLPAELIGEASSVGLGEAISKITTGKWQSLPQVLQEANEGGVLGAVGEAGGLALESGLAKGAGALTKLLSGSEDLASKVSGLTPVWRAAGGALTNTALQAPFTQNPEQLGIAAAIGGLAGGLGPGVAGKIASKIDEIRGTGGVAELETLRSPLTGETTEAWKITLPSGDTVHLVPRTTFGEGDIRDFVDAYGDRTTLAIHSTPSRQFLEDVANGEETVKVTGNPPGGAFKFREPGKLRDLYLSPGESENEGVALAGYTGLRDMEPSIPEFRLGQSDIKSVFDRFLHPFDKGGLIGVKTDTDVIEPPEELRDYILSKKAEYLRQGVNPDQLNNLVMEDLLKDEKYGNMYRDYINKVRTYSAETGKPVTDIEGLLGLSHERQIELASGAKLRGTGEEYNIWVRQTPELLENLPGPLRDILSDWSRLKYVGAEIVPGEPLNLFEDETRGERAPRLRDEEGGEGGERILNEGGLQGEEGGLREPLWLEREPEGLQTYISLPQITYSSPLPIINSPPLPIVSPPPSPIINPPPSPTISPPPSPIISPPPSPIVNPPPSPIVNPPPSPIINPPPSPIVNPPPSPNVNPPPSPIVNPPPSPIINPPPSPIVNPPPSPNVNPPPSPIVNPPPSPIINPPPSPIINPPSVYIQQELQSPPPPVFSSSSVTQSESGAPPPMGPPPMLPMIMPGGFGGGKNNQEISGMAGEVIYL